MARPSVAFVGPLERVLSLRALPMLEHVSADELAVIAQHARERTFSKGSYLMEPGVQPTAGFVVLDGRVTVSRGNTTEEAGPNESVGFIELLARQPAMVTAQAAVDTQTLELDWEAQLDICEQYFSILLRYTQYLCRWHINVLRPLSGGNIRDETDEAPAVSDRPLNLIERALILRKSPVFSRCSPDAVWELTRHMSEVRFEADQNIWVAEDSSDYFVMMASGLVQCTDRSGGSVVAGCGKTLGMLETVTSSPRWFAAQSLSPVTALKVDGEAFLDILEDHFDMSMEYAGAIARGILRADPGSTMQIA